MKKIESWLRVGCLAAYVVLCAALLLQHAAGNVLSAAAPDAPQQAETSIRSERISDWITEMMDKGGIPGVSAVITSRDHILYHESFGYADLESDQPVTSATLFELGSNSKAFTALAIMQLAADGLLDLDAAAARYNPGFSMELKEENTGNRVHPEVTVRQLLHHTSGIPFQSIQWIAPAEDDEALERTVAAMNGQLLASEPGTRFEYATLNYDVLGLIIQNINGMLYEDYIQQHVLLPYGLDNTYLFHKDTQALNMATGYKPGFLRPLPYDAPVYRGNTPAGYLISNTEDMGRWLQIQLDAAIESEAGMPVFSTQVPDRTVSPSLDGSSYAGGWMIYQHGAGLIAHGGSNPNYSSFMLLLPGENMAVAVLANINSAYTDALARGIMSILEGKEPNSQVTDLYKRLDQLMTAVTVVALLLSIALLVLIGLLIRDFTTGARSFGQLRLKHGISLVGAVLFLAFISYCLWKLPEVMFDGLSWGFVQVWAPVTLQTGVWSALCVCVLLTLYALGVLLFPRQREKALFPLIMLSSVSGFGNALVIFAVIQSINRLDQFNIHLFLYYVLGIAVYVVGQQFIRRMMIQLAHGMVYEKRTTLIHNILQTPFDRFEKLDKSDVYAVLKGDTEIVSNMPNLIVSTLTNLFTLFLCFVYLGILSFSGLILSVAIISLAVFFYFILGRSANRYWERSRDIQNHFFGFIHDMLHGFKELRLSRAKNRDFQQTVSASNEEYRHTSVQAAMKFTHAFIIGELLFVVVIGAVAFLFPSLFSHFERETLAAYIFIFLYMTGPVNAVLGFVPELMRMRISWRRVEQLEQATTQAEASESALPGDFGQRQPAKLQLKDVGYEYKNDSDQSFGIGPISLHFRSGEITFIAGGNGSGKTTLAKLITGLYEADNGEILLDGIRVKHTELGDYFANVFSDYYLFKKLYGMDVEAKMDEAQQYLNLLQIQDKVTIADGQLSTIALSSGQRKRLALLISYLEDKPFYLFDEWAADQDPQFRSFFYEELLPMLKAKGKCVIAITHDDRFFHLADHVIQMNRGKVVYHAYAGG